MAGHKAYEELTAALEKTAYPCENDPTFAEFGFRVDETWTPWFEGFYTRKAD